MLILATVVVSGGVWSWTVLTKRTSNTISLWFRLYLSGLPLAAVAFALSMLQWKKPYFAAS